MVETTGADELATLRAEAEAAGVKVDGRWGADRLRSEIEAARPAGAGETDPPESIDGEAPGADDIDDASRVVDETDSSESMPADGPAPVVHRAGGWVDRGEGRGWELEE